MTFKKSRTDTIQVSLSHVHTRKTCVCGTCMSCEVSVLFTRHQAPPLPSVKLVFIPFHTPLVVTSLAHTGRAKFTTLVHDVLGEGPALFIVSPTLPVTSETDFVRLQTAYLGGPRASLHLILVDIHLLRHAARTLACPRFMFFSLFGSCSCLPRPCPPACAARTPASPTTPCESPPFSSVASASCTRWVIRVWVPDCCLAQNRHQQHQSPSTLAPKDRATKEW